MKEVIMAKRSDKKKDDRRLERTITRNWIICGLSLLAIIVLLFMSNG